ncbi:hypothetical protein SASPL_120082 [Salvia splendens]|uniref:Chaperonin GroEL n=1 Tax=Salvia splendens TaxID=180675 RepID=A0A8X8XNZ6_SALSN|nr:hypothetical protein SASPL_120082 [Salvia splendens]
MSDTFENLLEAGVIDPAKVTRCALQNAASVAGMVLTTQAIVVDKPKPRAFPAAAGSATDAPVGTQEFGVTEHDGIEKLIDLLPDSWKEWAERTARRYTWHEPATDDMVGDMAGFRKAVYCALVDSREEQPPQEVEERVVYQDKYVSMYEGEQGFEGDYGEEPEEAPQGNPEVALQENPEEDDDEDPEEGPMDEDDRVVVEN